MFAQTNTKRKRKRKILVTNAIIGLTYLCGNAYAEESYKNAAFITQSTASTASSDSASISAGLQMYFTPVEFGDYPYGEAFFIDRHSSVAFYGVRNKTEYIDSTFNGNAYGGSITYSENQNPLSVSFSFERATRKGKDNAISFKLDDDSTTIDLGVNATRFTKITVSFISENGNGFADGQSYFSVTDKSYEMGFRHLSVFSNNFYISFGLNAGIRDSLIESQGNETSYNSSRVSYNTSFYFDKTLSLGLSYNKYKVNNYEQTNGSSRTVSLHKYFSHMTSIDASLSNSNSSTGSKVENLFLGLSHRF